MSHEHAAETLKNVGSHGSETLKHAGDAVFIPGGVIGILSPYLEFMNTFLTFLVLITSLIWGVYRVIEMRENRKINHGK